VSPGVTFAEYTPDGVLQSLDKAGQEITVGENYTLTGNTLTILGPSGSVNVEVRTLTSDSLVTVQTRYGTSTPVTIYLIQSFVR
jgi:hypothetical protein